MLIEHKIEIRVHYHEVDGQGRVHNANYLNYFERGRVDMLRSAGFDYKQIEESGLMLVVRKMEIDYLFPALFDDILTLTTTVIRAKGVRIEHDYSLIRASDARQIVTAKSLIACIDRSGAVRRLPDYLQIRG